jgi:hypothetical protein
MGLVEKSLVNRAEAERFTIHNLIRRFAREKLVESGLFEETKCFMLLSSQKGGSFTYPSIFWTPLLEQVQANCHDFQAALGWAYKYK